MHASLIDGLSRLPDAHRYTTLNAAEAASSREALIAEHPDPGAGSLKVAAWARNQAKHSATGDLLITCVSGGGSSMMCGWGTEHHAGRRALIANLRARGASIEEINAVRSALDPLKCGGLRRQFEPGDTLTFVLSDTPFAPASVVASGPTIPSARAPIDAILARYELPLHHDHAGWTNDTGAEPLGARDTAHMVVEVGGNDTMVTAVVEALREDIDDVHRGPSLRGDAFEAGQRFARMLCEDERSLIVSGGECTTEIRGRGRGGRTMEFALGAAQRLRGRAHLGVLVLSTDGQDGTSGAGGAVAHGGTLLGLQRRGLSLADLLSRSDSATGLRAVAGLIESHPTGTNVADIALGWRLPDAPT
jgi:glycerate-2-kinase